MNRDMHNIRKNVNVAKKSYNLSCDILNGQIEEFVSLFENAEANYENIATLYSELFDEPYLSKIFIRTCYSLSERNILLSKYFEIDSFPATVSYVDNSYSRKALEKFKSIVNVHSEAENDFVAVCESVYSKRSKYGVLPLLNTRDGLILSLYKILQKYDLKIIASTKVVMNDGETETEFFLISRDVFITSVCNRLILSTTHSYDSTLVELLYALKSVGVKLLSINTLPLEYTDERCENLLIIDLLSCRHEAICCFLSAALPDANIVGIYNYVK